MNDFLPYVFYEIDFPSKYRAFEPNTGFALSKMNENYRIWFMFEMLYDHGNGD